MKGGKHYEEKERWWYSLDLLQFYHDVTGVVKNGVGIDI